MRCNNCGWENNPGNMKCEKCNAPLKGSMIDNGNHASQADQSSNSPLDNRPLRGTLNEKDAFNNSPSKGNGINIDKGNSKCNNCGYPVSPNMNTCPSCGIHLSNTGSSTTPQGKTCSNCGNILTPGAQFCSNCGRPTKMGTINSGPQAGAGSFFTLRPIPWDTETVQYQPVSYSGKVVSLNRANTDSNNSSITSKVQAIISNVNGEWFIEDKSAYQSTLIHVRGKVKLQDGDIIVMGNRKFEFKG